MTAPGKYFCRIAGRARAARGEVGRADDTQTDTVSKSVAVESVPGPLPAQLERRALDVLPAERPADDDAEILAGNLGRGQAVDAQAGHAARTVSRDDPHVAKPVAAKAGGAKSAQQIRRPELRLPRRRPFARLVVG